MKLTKQRGITLIALVITIVVLLILAGVTVNSILGDNGLFNRAQDAQNKMHQAEENDLTGLSNVNKYIREQAGEIAKLKPYEDVKKAENTGTVEEDAKYKDDENNIAVIPKGYKISEQNGERTISTGLVIKDESGNEFVWIPVDDISEYKRTAWNGENVKEAPKPDEEKENAYYSTEGGVYTFLGKQEDETKIERVAVIKDNITTGNFFLGLDDEKSVEKYGGFYMGRYEASYDEANDKIETKPNKTPYTNIDMSKVIYKQDTVDDGSLILNYNEQYNNAKIVKLALHPANEGENSTNVIDDSNSGTTGTKYLRKCSNSCF